ncbi:MAG: HEAT repeat domain-containing protein [Desulfotignum sp.]|jgi:CheY-like chemotaxis protein|nr:HEAT repeat domain-containing protein [Desulfotignum sp.]
MTDYLIQLKQMVRTARLDPGRSLLDRIGQQPEPQKRKALELLALTPDANAAAMLRHLLIRQTDETLLAGILHTIGKFRRKDMVTDVAEFLFYDNALLKTQAVRALEKIGTPNALRCLEQAAKTDKCDQDILDAIAGLTAIIYGSLAPAPAPAPDPDRQPQKKPEYKKNLARLGSRHLEKCCQAFAYFLNHSSQAAAALNQNLDSHNHDLLIRLLHLVSITTPQGAARNILDLVSRNRIGSHLKFAAYDALQAFSGRGTAVAALKGVTDTSSHVRMAAAATLQKNCSDPIISQVRSIVESGTKTGETLVQAILDVRAAKLISALINTDTFFYAASNHLEKTACAPVLETFIHVLENRNRWSSARKYRQILDIKACEPRKTIVVTSLSQTCLDVYTKLIWAAGFRALPFNSSQDAFEAIVSHKPDAVVCDLFLRNISGFDFSREIRELYAKNDLPVIISALHKNLDTHLLADAMNQSGVTGFFAFPASLETIKSWIITP